MSIMKNIICLAMTALALCSVASIEAKDALKGKKILFVYGGWEGHDPVGTRDLFVPWLQGEGAEVIQSDKLSVYADKELMASIDLIIQTWTMGTLTGDEERGLLEAVRRGTGFAGWHGGIGDSFRNNTDYQYMVGGQWVAHPGGPVSYTVKVKDKRDPVMKGIKTFEMHTEQYYLHVDPNVKVLATTEFSGDNDSWIKGCVMPVTWKKMYGEGRVFYSSLCHDAGDFKVPEALEIMKRGICWAVRP